MHRRAFLFGAGAVAVAAANPAIAAGAQAAPVASAATLIQEALSARSVRFEQLISENSKLMARIYGVKVWGEGSDPRGIVPLVEFEDLAALINHNDDFEEMAA